VECVLRDRIRKTADLVDQPLAPSSPFPDLMTSRQRNHAATIVSTEFFNSLG
jgi:hypothetical protein